MGKYLILNLSHLRLAQFELSGTMLGSKSAAVAMDARSAKTDLSNLLRKVVVARLKGEELLGLNFTIGDRNLLVYPLLGCIPKY